MTTIFAQTLRTFDGEAMTPMTHAFFSLATVVGTMVIIWAILALAIHTLDRIENALRRYSAWWQRTLRQVIRKEGR